MHMNAIRSVFEALQSQKKTEKDYEIIQVFDLCLNLYHKNPILKNSKNVYAAICRPIALKSSPSLGSKFN